jgi:acetate kinase
MRILVLNCGSSSVKLRVMDADSGHCRNLLHGSVTGIGGHAQLTVTLDTGKPATVEARVPDHGAAVDLFFSFVQQSAPAAAILAEGIDAVGHRIVHGGDRFQDPALIDAGNLAAIDELAALAPLHNPACVAGIRAAQRALGDAVPMVAVFDTAFHQAMPDVAKQYALPRDLVRRYRIRRYGFHGIAHASLLDGYLRAAGKAADATRVITLQLGNGCSAAAIANGRSVDTSMGFTPLEGLVMGTRSGDLDPALVSYLSDAEGATPQRVEQLLNEESGLLGLSGRSNDMRVLLAAVTEEKHGPSKLAVDVFCYRAKKYVGAYLAALGGADAIVFGGGIGEASPAIRNGICAGMEWCGVVLDEARNRAVVNLPAGHAESIGAVDAGVDVYVVAADEQTWIARETVRCLHGYATD